jgi:O-antigen ligase
MMLSPETVADVAAIILLCACVPAALIVYGVRAWRRGLRVPEGLGPVLAVTLSLAISHSVAVDSSDSADRIIQWLCYVALFYIAQQLPGRLSRAALAGVGIVVGAAVLAGVANGGRSAGILRNPNISAGVLAVVLPTLPQSLGFWALAGALVATGSRGAFLGVLVPLAWRKIKRRWLALAVIVVALVLLVAVRPSTVRKRALTWSEAGRLFLARPVAGWGAGSYPHLAKNEQFHPHADSFPLTVAAEQGLLGLVAWGWLLYEICLDALWYDHPERLGVAAFCVQNLVDATLWWYWPGIAIALCSAIAANPPQWTDKGLALLRSVRDGRQ